MEEAFLVDDTGIEPVTLPTDMTRHTRQPGPLPDPVSASATMRRRSGASVSGELSQSFFKGFKSTFIDQNNPKRQTADPTGSPKLLSQSGSGVAEPAAVSGVGVCHWQCMRPLDRGLGLAPGQVRSGVLLGRSLGP
jgi:hypothetical protein